MSDMDIDYVTWVQRFSRESRCFQGPARIFSSNDLYRLNLLIKQTHTSTCFVLTQVAATNNGMGACNLPGLT